MGVDKLRTRPSGNTKNPRQPGVSRKAPRPPVSWGDPEDTIITEGELCLLMGWGLSTARQKRREETGPPSLRVPGSRLVRYRLGDVKRWLSALNGTEGAAR